MITARLGIAPLSAEITEAVFRYSHSYKKELMLIPSKNQIDYIKGYVNGWTTKEFRRFIDKTKKAYSQSSVKLCRDHCGPGFNGKYDIRDTYRTIGEDIANGFELIHIDFSHFKYNAEKRLEGSKKAIEYCLKLNSDVRLEVGDDGNGNRGAALNLPADVKKEIGFFMVFCKPQFYVVQTGSLVRGGRQAGLFDESRVKKIAHFIHSKGIKLKEHNADYLSRNAILKRKSIVDAMNIAPHLGTTQTRFVLDRAGMHGVNCDDFSNIVYKGRKWKKWVGDHDAIDRLSILQIAGHYHYTSDEYKKLIDQLSRYEDMHEGIINSIMKVIGHYEDCR